LFMSYLAKSVDIYYFFQVNKYMMILKKLGTVRKKWKTIKFVYHVMKNMNNDCYFCLPYIYKNNYCSVNFIPWMTKTLVKKDKISIFTLWKLFSCEIRSNSLQLKLLRNGEYICFYKLYIFQRKKKVDTSKQRPHEDIKQLVSRDQNPFSRSLFVFLYFFFWSLCCLFFDLRILTTPLVASHSSFYLYNYLK
jgi:hypothetical protein